MYSFAPEEHIGEGERETPACSRAQIVKLHITQGLRDLANHGLARASGATRLQELDKMQPRITTSRDGIDT